MKHNVHYTSEPGKKVTGKVSWITTELDKSENLLKGLYNHNYEIQNKICRRNKGWKSYDMDKLWQ